MVTYLISYCHVKDNLHPNKVISHIQIGFQFQGDFRDEYNEFIIMQNQGTYLRLSLSSWTQTFIIVHLYAENAHMTRQIC